MWSKEIVKRSKKISFLLFSAFVLITLSGCERVKYANSKICPQSQFAHIKKAVIITKAEHKYSGLILRGSTPVDFVFSKVDSNYPDNKQRLRYRNPYIETGIIDRIKNNKYEFMMIEPGIYALENIKYQLGETEYFSTLDGLNPGTEHFVYAGFNVKPGEIVYLGDMDINLEGKNFEMQVTDNYDEAVTIFRKRHPNYAEYPIKKRLIQHRGTCLTDIDR